MTHIVKTIVFALAVALVGTACDSEPLNPCDPTSPLNPELTPEQQAECDAGTGEEEVAVLDCFLNPGDTFAMCWAPDKTTDLSVVINGVETFEGVCNDKWGQFEWVIGDGWSAHTVLVSVCGLPGEESRNALDDIGFSIQETFRDGQWSRFLPTGWPTSDMSTLAAPSHYCAEGVVCNEWVGNGCFCKCDSDSDCEGIGQEMVCLDGENASPDVGNLPICAYDGEVG